MTYRLLLRLRWNTRALMYRYRVAWRAILSARWAAAPEWVA